MTVAELIEKLNAMPMDAEVSINVHMWRSKTVPEHVERLDDGTVEISNYTDENDE